MALRVCEYCGKAWIGATRTWRFPCVPAAKKSSRGSTSWLELPQGRGHGVGQAPEGLRAGAGEYVLEVDVKAIETLVKLGKIQTEASLGERTPEEKKRNLDKLSRIRKGIKKGLK